MEGRIWPMFADLRKAALLIRDPAFAGVVWKSLALTLLLFGVLFAGLRPGFICLPPQAPGVQTAVDWLASVLLLILLFFLGAPVAALFASLFLDEIAEAVEGRFYPADPKAPGMTFWTALWTGLRLFVWVLLCEPAAAAAQYLLARHRHGDFAVGERLAVGPRIFRARGAAPSFAAGGG